MWNIKTNIDQANERFRPEGGQALLEFSVIGGIFAIIFPGIFTIFAIAGHRFQVEQSALVVSRSRIPLPAAEQTHWDSMNLKNSALEKLVSHFDLRDDSSLVNVKSSANLQTGEIKKEIDSPDFRKIDVCDRVTQQKTEVDLGLMTPQANFSALFEPRFPFSMEDRELAAARKWSQIIYSSFDSNWTSAYSPGLSNKVNENPANFNRDCYMAYRRSECQMSAKNSPLSDVGRLFDGIIDKVYIAETASCLVEATGKGAATGGPFAPATATIAFAATTAAIASGASKSVMNKFCPIANTMIEGVSTGIRLLAKGRALAVLGAEDIEKANELNEVAGDLTNFN